MAVSSVSESPAPLWQRAWPHVLAVLFFVLLAVVYFAPIVFQHQTLAQHDIAQFQGGAHETQQWAAEHGHEPHWTNSMVWGDAYLPDFHSLSGRLVCVGAAGHYAGAAGGGEQFVCGAALWLRAAGGAGRAAAGGGGGRGGAGLFELQPGHLGGRAQHQVVGAGLRAAGAGRADAGPAPQPLAGRGAVHAGPHAGHSRQSPADNLLFGATGGHLRPYRAGGGGAGRAAGRLRGPGGAAGRGRGAGGGRELRPPLHHLRVQQVQQPLALGAVGAAGRAGAGRRAQRPAGRQGLRLCLQLRHRREHDLAGAQLLRRQQHHAAGAGLEPGQSRDAGRIPGRNAHLLGRPDLRGRAGVRGRGGVLFVRAGLVCGGQAHPLLAAGGHRGESGAGLGQELRND